MVRITPTKKKQKEKYTMNTANVQTNDEKKEKKTSNGLHGRRAMGISMKIASTASFCVFTIKIYWF